MVLEINVPPMAVFDLIKDVNAAINNNMYTAGIFVVAIISSP